MGQSQVTGAPPAAKTRARREGSRARFARASAPYLFIAPFFVIFFVFFAYPVAYSFYVSLYSWNGAEPMKWVGWDNYSFVLSDPYFLEALATTGLIWLSVPVTIVLALVLAAIWNQRWMWGRSVLLVMYLLPTVISIVAASVVFRILYDPIAGPIDIALGWLHIPPVNWLEDESSARLGLFLLRIWETLGLGVLFIAASLQAIPQDYYDAAAVDGCGSIYQFMRITVPLLGRTMLFLAVWYSLSALSLFAEPYLVMNQGGPNNATVTLGFYLMQKVINLDYGTASAVSFLTTIVMVVISMLLFLGSRRWISD